MAKAVAVYGGGIAYLFHLAVREDGVLFVRYQNKTIYGYRWGAWRKAGGEAWGENMRANPPGGFEYAGYYVAKQETGARLPNAGEA